MRGRVHARRTLKGLVADLRLAEKKKTNKWLGEQLGKDKTTISKWCTNTCQPDLGNLMKIAKLLEVEVTDLLRQDNID